MSAAGNGGAAEPKTGVRGGPAEAGGPAAPQGVTPTGTEGAPASPQAPQPAPAARTAPAESAAGPAEPAPAPTGAAQAVRPGGSGSGPAPAPAAAPATRPDPEATPAPGGRPSTGLARPGGRDLAARAGDGVDLGWIAGGRVKAVAVPVAANAGETATRSGSSNGSSNNTSSSATSSTTTSTANGNNGNNSNISSNSNSTSNAGTTARRRTVIGTETTGSIPVHLLFRDQPAESTAADDGGPDTVPVPKTKAPQDGGAKGGKGARGGGRNKAAIPGPARPAAKSSPARPAPTADPKLVERPGPVLPGWVGVAGGVLALVGCAAIVWWTGAVPAEAARMLRLPSRPYHGIHLGQWALLALGVVLALFFVGGLGRGRVGYALVLTLFGDYRGTVRRTGLLWVSPLLLRRRVDVRLRHWRSEPLPAVDAKGTALDVVVLVVWRIRDTVRAALGVDRHEEYLREQVEAAMARVLSQLPADAFHEDAPTLRDAEAVGEALTRMLSAECAPVGIDVFSAQPTRIEYAPEVAAAMQRRRIAAIDAKHRDSVLTSVVDAVDDVVHRLTSRGLVELDDYERKALVKDLTVAFYTGRTAPAEGA
ncbi:SPFH domain-containing protein [Streptomyces sp. NPDC012637]|uniref:SPFH domain-containing protein n=1 Tax=Streptomyces sp. NPDC012637 TaxID=3364842 RepID=UPI0036EFB391